MTTKRVIVTSYTADDLDWDSEQDYRLTKERHGKEPIYFVYQRSWTIFDVYSNLPDLYSESGGYSVVRRKCRPDNALHL
jgi:hypothetical protein|tara:strand:+ start:57 stop:293 length:237 start_codon:yes stop_codon:yes gene_type:complete